MPDGWEVDYGLDPKNPADGSEALGPDGRPIADKDGDGLSNIEEHRYGSRPDRVSTIQDGFSDFWKHRWELDPQVALVAGEDPDDDGLTNEEEHTHGTDPNEKDSDGDGWEDGWEVANGFDPGNRLDTDGDLDGDRVTNQDEILMGTNPDNGVWQTLTIGGTILPEVNEFDELLASPSANSNFQLYRSGAVFREFAKPSAPHGMVKLTEGGLPVAMIPLTSQGQAKVWVGGEDSFETNPAFEQSIPQTLPGGSLLLSSKEDPVAGFLTVFQSVFRKFDPIRSSLQRLTPLPAESFRSDRVVGPLRDGTCLVTGRPFQHGLVTDPITGVGALLVSEPLYFQTKLFRVGEWIDLSLTGDQRRFWGMDVNGRGEVLGIANAEVGYHEWSVVSDDYVHIPGEIVIWRNGQWIYTGIASLHETILHKDIHLTEEPGGGLSFRPYWLDLAEDGSFTALVPPAAGPSQARISPWGPGVVTEVEFAERAYAYSELIRWQDGNIVPIAQYPREGEFNLPQQGEGYSIIPDPIIWPAFVANDRGDVAETSRQNSDGTAATPRFFGHRGGSREIAPHARRLTSDGGLLYSDRFVYWQVTDTDQDGMANDWEQFHGLSTTDPADAPLDPDDDGLSSFVEYRLGTDPNNDDTDGDELNDGWEHRYGFDPLSADEIDVDLDDDGDDLVEESLYGSDPHDAVNDRDGDGMDDRYEYLSGLNPDDASDSSGDDDFDGISNYYESGLGTHPKLRDSDIDGVIDSLEVWGYPTDATDEEDFVDYGGSVTLSAGEEMSFDLVIPNTMVRDVTALLELGEIVYEGEGSAPDTTGWFEITAPQPAAPWEDFILHVTLRPGSHYLGGTFRLPFALRESLGRTSLEEPAFRDDLIVSSGIALDLEPEITVTLSGDFSAVAEGGAMPMTANLVIPPDLIATELELYFDGTLVSEVVGSTGSPLGSTVALSAPVFYRLGESFQITARVFDGTGRSGPLSAAIPVTVTAVADSIDLDALPDYWEQAIVDFDPNDEFSDVSQIQENDDFDGDGLTNLEEFLGKTDPTDPDGDRNGIFDGWDGELDLIYSGASVESLHQDISGAFTAWASSGVQTTTLNPVGTPAVVNPAFRSGAAGLTLEADAGAVATPLASPLTSAEAWTVLGVFEPDAAFFDPTSTTPKILATLPGFVQVSAAAGLIHLTENHPDALEPDSISTSITYAAPTDREAWGFALVRAEAETDSVSLQVGPLSDWPARASTLALTLPERTRALASLSLGARTTPAPEENGEGMASLHGVWLADDTAFSAEHLGHYFTTVAPLWQPGEPVAPEVEITTPAQNSRYASPAVIHLAATVTENGSPVQQVAFYTTTKGVETLLGTDTAAPFEGFWRVKRNDTYFVIAKATDANGIVASSTPRIIIVKNTPGNGNPASNFRPGFTLVGPAQPTQPTPFNPRGPNNPGGPGPGGPNPGGPTGPGPQNAPVPTGDDLDDDGRADSADWVDYDPELDAWDRTGVPRFAVIQTGAFTPWRSNKFGMVLGYVGSKTDVDSTWYVWYQGEWNPNKIDLESFTNLQDAELSAIPELSQEHPVVYGQVTGTRDLGCNDTSTRISVGYAFTPDAGFVVLQESAPPEGEEAGLYNYGLNPTGDRFTGSVGGVIEKDRDGVCTERFVSGPATWTLSGVVSPDWSHLDDDDGENDDDGNGGTPIEPCDPAPTKLPLDPPKTSQNPSNQSPSPRRVPIGGVTAVTYFKMCKEDKKGPESSNYEEEYRAAVEEYNAAVDQWEPGDECPKLQLPGAPSSGDINIADRGEYEFNSARRPAVTDPLVRSEREALSNPILFPTSPDLVVVTRGSWQQGGFLPNSNCRRQNGTFTRDRNVLWVTHDGKNDLVELTDGKGGSVLDMGQFTQGRTFTVGQNGLGGLWADGKVHPWPELTGGKNISLWNWYVGRDGLSCAKADGQGAILVPVEVVPDYNRDGKIDANDRDKVTETNPWRWWVNDDDDGGEMKDADIPRHVGDGGDLTVNGLRDLVDWFPAWLNIPQLLKALPASDFEYVLECDEFSLNSFETTLSTGAAGDFLRADLGPPTERNNPNGLVSIAAQGYIKRVMSNTAKFSAEFLGGIEDGTGGVLLLEAHDETAKPLRLVVRESGGGNEVVNVAILPLKISQVEKMYRHVDLRSMTKNPDGSNAGGQPSSFPGRERIVDPGEPFPDEHTNGKYFVFIHGFNVTANRARGWNAEIFKRLHQMGSRARFIGMSWHGDTGLQIDEESTNYHQAVFHAFQTGDALASKLAFVDGDLTIAAHSLGNIVASHAISEAGLSPSRYYMINAAAPLEAYNSAGIPVSQQTAMTEESWEDYMSMQHLFSARWHELFDDESDPRRDLTWRDRFAAVLPKAFNFYSTGEDVVQNPQTNSASLIANGFRLGRGAWGAQEFAKGVAGQKFHPVIDVIDYSGALLQSPPQAGWGFSDRYKHNTPDGTPFWLPPGPEDAANLTPEFLRENPLFRDFLVSNLTDPVQGSGLAAQQLVKYHVLAGGIPALSYAAAANPVNGLQGFNMQSEFKTGSFWPDEGHEDPEAVGNWLHSDFKNVALSFVHKMYTKMIELGGLDE